jgi:murein DD-endopeptidase MepM/ murein hydrolase activator NlpD
MVRSRRYTLRLQLLFALAMCVSPCSALASEKTPAPAPRGGKVWSIEYTPLTLINGVPVLLEITPATRLKSLEGTLLGHTLVFESADGKKWTALAGISLETKPGKYPLKVSAVTAAGKEIHFEQAMKIGQAKYLTVELKVAREFTEPSPEQQQEIKKDQDIKHEAFSKVSPEREWSGSFRPPVTAETSDVFGTRRVFNGETKSVHQGLDYRVGPGTPVAAVNSGTVILAQPLYFEGNCVVIDHGQGLLTLYLHLSELKVKAGDRVERGTVVGLSGASGRATGPHLHLAVRWQGVYLDPAVLLRLRLPEVVAKKSPPRP